MYNYRFHKDYNDAIANQLFLFNCLNSYVPLLYVAFFKQNYQALFTMLFIMLIFDQWRTAAMRVLTPCWYRRTKQSIVEDWDDKLRTLY